MVYLRARSVQIELQQQTIEWNLIKICILIETVVYRRGFVITDFIWLIACSCTKSHRIREMVW